MAASAIRFCFCRDRSILKQDGQRTLSLRRPITTMKLAYVGIRVRDLKKSITFYTRVLGLKVSHRGHMHHGGQFVNLVDKVTGQHLELNWYPKRSAFYRSIFLQLRGTE